VSFSAWNHLIQPRVLASWETSVLLTPPSTVRRPVPHNPSSRVIREKNLKLPTVTSLVKLIHVSLDTLVTPAWPAPIPSMTTALPAFVSRNKSKLS
jgi:hypothetical protein